MSVIEVSHRGKAFVACAAETEARFRSVMGVPDDYAVLFLQGGATGQFAGVPMNLTAAGDSIDLLNTGQWSAKALSEAKKFGLDVRVVADEAASKYTTTPAAGSYELHADAKYVHYTPLSLIHISEPTRLGMISYAVFCLQKKKSNNRNKQVMTRLEEKIEKTIKQVL